MAYYFKHDDNARRDPKLIKLRRIKGMRGIGIYWCLIEIIHEQNGEISSDEINSISFELQEDENVVLDVLKNYDLFVIQQNVFGNTRVSESLQERHKKSNTAKNNIKKRWSKEVIDNQQVNTVVLQEKYHGNTIREEKRREEKNIYIGDVEEILHYLNEKTGKVFTPTKSNQKHIIARLKEKFTLQDLKKVIDIKSSQWIKDVNMKKYLRPETLFGSKFEGYKNEFIEDKTPIVPVTHQDFYGEV